MWDTAEEPVPAAGSARVAWHEALFFGAVDELVAAAVDHLDGASGEPGQAGLLLCSEVVAERVLDTLDADARVIVLDRAEVFRNATVALTRLQAAVREVLAAGATGVRLVDEVALGGSLEQAAERTRFDALVNLAFADLPVHSLCAVAGDLGDRAAQDARRTHPVYRDGGDRRESAEYEAPAAVLAGCAVTDPDPVELQDPVLDVAGSPTLVTLRDTLRDVLGQRDVRPDVVDDLVVAVNEVTSNVYRHAAPPARIRLWVTDDRVVCTVTDHGAGSTDPTLGYLAPDAERMESGGMGLWLARQLTDRVDLLPGDGTFTVRLTRRS